MQRERVDPRTGGLLGQRPRPAAPAPAEEILRLQRSAGNAAVGLALQQAPPAAVSTIDQRLVTAAAAADWQLLAQLLLAAEERAMVRQLGRMATDDLRYLDDAVRRLGVRNSRLRIFIKAGLRQRGADDEQSAPGGGYGVMEGKETLIEHGAVRAHGNNKRARYRFEITFLPSPGVVDADEIDFIQTARVLSTTEGTIDASGNLDWDNEGVNGPGRRTSDDTRVDRLGGHDQGWYGMEDGGTPATTLRPWRRGSRSPAWMRDTPSRTTGNQDFEFETAAVCRRGADAGMVYATITWGFSLDGALKVTPKQPRLFNKQSRDFELAVTFWNAEASGANPSSPNQQQLPGNLR